MTAPTSRQQELHSWMVQYQLANSMPPTLREICEAFGFASTNTAADHLRLMEPKGLVKRHRGKARGWVAVESA